MSVGREGRRRHLSVDRLLVGVTVGLVIGIAAGFGSAAFLHALTWATETRVDRPWLLWLLPVAGLGIGLLRKAAGSATAGTNLLLDEFHVEEGDHDLLPDDAAPGGRVPLHMAPYVLLGSLTTHLFGGSGGREGAAVQIAAGLAAPAGPAVERAARRSGISPLHVRRLLVVAALAGGFGSVSGVPFAGTIFGTEALRRWRPRTSAHLRTRIDEAVAFLPAAAVASFVGHIVTTRLGIHHPELPPSIPRSAWGSSSSSHRVSSREHSSPLTTRCTRRSSGHAFSLSRGRWSAAHWWWFSPSSSIRVRTSASRCR